MLALTSCDSGKPQSRDAPVSTADSNMANSIAVKSIVTSGSVTGTTNKNSMTNSYVGSGGKFFDITKNQNSEVPFSKINSKSGTLSGLDSDASGINSIDPTQKLMEPGDTGNSVLNSKINARSVDTVSTGTGGVSVTTIRSGK